MEAEKVLVKPAAEKKAVKQKPEKKAISERFVPGATKCRFCSATLRVNHTDKQEMAGGKLLITRSVKCNGPRRHTYDHHEEVTLATASAK